MWADPGAEVAEAACLGFGLFTRHSLISSDLLKYLNKKVWGELWAEGAVV